MFGFLTAEANAIMAAVHPKAMLVILTTPAEVGTWLEAEAPDALALQRPLLGEALMIVAKGGEAGAFSRWKSGPGKG